MGKLFFNIISKSMQYMFLLLTIHLMLIVSGFIVFILSFIIPITVTPDKDV